MTREGLYPYGGCLEKGTIDDLAYEYYNGDTGNQLRRVTDNAPEGCISDLILTEQISSSVTHEAGNTITANNLISSNVSSLTAIDVQYLAGNCINLEAGFEVTLGEMFLADIQPCGGTDGNKTEGFQQNSPLIYTYDANGNLKRDPNKKITTTFNHLDLPKVVLFDDGRKLEFTYSASGTLLTKKAVSANNSVAERRDYVSGLEYLNGNIESIYHSQGRVHYVNNLPRYEYTATDHLGNTRLTYSDLNNDGKIDTPSEILQENHYYPYGMAKKGPWMDNLSTPMAYQFNGIEKIDNFDLGVNMATFRTLDPALGVWWSVDPAAEVLAPMSPYCAMNGSPMVYNDPDGDIPPIIIGAALLGGSLNLWSNWGDVKGIMDGLGYFTSGAVGGGISTVNPTLGAVVTSFGNLGIDMGNGTLSKLQSPAEIITHLGFTALEGIGAGGAAQLAQGIGTIFKFSWTEYGRIGQLSAIETQLIANEGIELSFSQVPTRVASSTISTSNILKSTAAGVASGVGKGGGKDLALGLGDDLFNFANYKGFDTYRNFSTGFKKDKILEAMKNYDNIHFNTTGFGKYKFSQFNPSKPLTYRNYTNWEMHTILNDPSLLSKTTFYKKLEGSGYEILKNYSPIF